MIGKRKENDVVNTAFLDDLFRSVSDAHKSYETRAEVVPNTHWFPGFIAAGTLSSFGGQLCPCPFRDSSTDWTNS